MGFRKQEVIPKRRRKPLGEESATNPTVSGVLIYTTGTLPIVA